MPKIKSVRVNKPGPISGLHISGIPESARLVVLIGPNGSGKTSLLDAFAVNEKGGKVDLSFANARPVDIEFHNQNLRSSLHLYIRSAYRTEHSVDVYAKLLIKVALPESPPRGAPSHRNPDHRVTKNFDVLLHQAYEISIKSCKTWEEAVSELFSPLNRRLNGIFPYLTISKIEYPTGHNNVNSLETLCFQKSGVRYQYAGLSAGEKEIFDLLFDLEMCAKDYPDALYCIDEPELHLHAELQGKLVVQLLDFLPEQSQLWIATHSLGIIREAMELYRSTPGAVVFLNFRDLQSSDDRVLRPSTISRSFWREALRIALHDVADLVSPENIVICEGQPVQPGTGKRKNPEFDAKIYRSIFGSSYPNADFISAGSCNDVITDSMKLQAALPIPLPGLKMIKLIDRDNKSDHELTELQKDGFRVLSRYSIENYLWSDEVLGKLLVQFNCASEHERHILALKANLLGREPESMENPCDCVKDIDGQLYNKLKEIPNLKGKGSCANEFALNCLAPLITPDSSTYIALRNDIFG